MIDKETLFKELSNELKFKKDREKFSKQLFQIDSNINTSKTYKEFLKKTKPIYDEIKKNSSENMLKLVIYYSKNHCYHLKTEWRKEFEQREINISVEVGKNPNDPEDTFLDYIKDEMLFNAKYKNEKFIIETLVFCSRPKTKEKEILIDRFLNFLKNNKDIYEFIDYSMQSKTKSWLDNDKMQRNTIEKLREERIYLFEYISTRKHLIEKSSYDETKILFEHDKELVKQNQNMYPIMLNYIDYIKKEILEANYHKPTKINAFKYISGLTINKKWVDVKSYYHDTYLILIGVKK